LLICHHGKSNPGIELRQISSTGKSLLIFRNRVKPRNQKYFPSRLTQIRCISIKSRPERGALRTSPTRGRDAVDAAAPLTNGAEAYGEVVSF
jgi:hypothetical protein